MTFEIPIWGFNGKARRGDAWLCYIKSTHLGHPQIVLSRELDKWCKEHQIPIQFAGYGRGTARFYFSPAHAVLVKLTWM